MRERGPEGENALAGKPARTTCDYSRAAGALAYHLDRRTIDQNDLVAPIELIGFPGASSGEDAPHRNPHQIPERAKVRKPASASGAIAPVCLHSRREVSPAAPAKHQASTSTEALRRNRRCRRLLIAPRQDIKDLVRAVRASTLRLVTSRLRRHKTSTQHYGQQIDHLTIAILHALQLAVHVPRLGSVSSHRIAGRGCGVRGSLTPSFGLSAKGAARPPSPHCGR